MIVSPGDEFALWVDDLLFSGRRIYRRPQFVTLITSYHGQEATAEKSCLSTIGLKRRSVQSHAKNLVFSPRQYLFAFCLKSHFSQLPPA